MAIEELDRVRMSQALDLAANAIGLSDPNPRVGCVVADSTGAVLATGFTQQAGGPHAEAAALATAQRDGRSLASGTAWVTLEPCAHHGRTPPCCDALIRAGVGRVVVATTDPFPSVAGAGIRRLVAAGIRVDVLASDDLLAQAAREMNIGFFSRFERGRPWIRVKLAMSLDGRTALSNGISQWITGEAARRDTHAWRRRASAVVTGVGTVIADRPRMDVRWVETTVQPIRVVIDSSGRTPADAPVLAAPGRRMIATTEASAPRFDRRRFPGVDMLVCRESGSKVDLAHLANQLADRGVNEMHVEAGSTLNGSFFKAGLVDEVLAYVAPMVLGSGPTFARFGPIERLEDAVRLRLHAVDAVGADLRLRFMAGQ